MDRTYCENVTELKQRFPELYNEMLIEYPESLSDGVRFYLVFDSLEDYAYYLATEGEIFGFNVEGISQNPDLSLFIDWYKLGKYLQMEGSDDMTYFSHDERVVHFW